MPRVNYVAKTRKDQGNCEVCSKPILRGDAYQYIEPRYGPKRVRHTTCRAWRPSEMSTSKMTTVWAAQEAFSDDSGTFDDVAAIVEAINAVAEAAREVGGEYEESAQNIEDGFGHEVPMSEELREKGEELEGWADELESTASDIEGEDILCATCNEDETESQHQHEYKAVADADTRQERDPDTCAVEDCELTEDEHHEFEANLDDIIAQAEEAVNNCPV